MDALEDSGIITFHTESISGIEYSSLDDTLPVSKDLPFESTMTPSMDMLQEQASQGDRVKKFIVLHHGQILIEFIVQVFSEESFHGG